MADSAVATAERTLPHNLEAERSVLGAILVQNDAFNLAAQLIDSKDFYRDAHRRIFDRMAALSERNHAIDFVTLKEELSRAGELDEVGGPSYVASLADGVPHATNVEYYAKIVKEKAVLRNLIYAANKIVADAYGAEQESDLILDEAESAIFSVADDRLKAGFVEMRDLVKENFPKIEQLFEQKRLITGVPTGFADMDGMTRGLQPGDLVIVAARPSMGKTSLVLNIAQYVAAQPDFTVGFFSLEMSKESLFLRLLTSEAHIDSHRLMSGAIGQKDYGKIAHALETLSSMKLHIDDTAGIGVMEMRAKARRLKSEHGLHLLIVDYVQLMTGRGRFENRTLELASISRSIKGLAKELNVPIILLSQLSRAPEARSDHRPQLSDLRECVTGETLVCLTDGRRLPICSLVGQTPSVWSVTPEGRVVSAMSDKVWKVGTRSVTRVKLASGRSITTTGEHRLLAGSGWTHVRDLEVGARLALSRRVPEAVGAVKWSDLRVALLGHLIGDGSYLRHQPLRYTTNNDENSSIVRRAAEEEFGCPVARHEAPTGSWHQLVISGNGNRWPPTGVNAWLRELGIFGQRSFQKRIPPAAFQLADEQVALLLRHLWATDGSILRRETGRGSNSAYYATTSEGLASDVAALLLRLGLVARTSVATKVGYRPSYHVRVSGVDQLRQFLEVVGAFGPRRRQAERLSEALVDVQANTNVDTLPREAFVRVRDTMRSRGISQRAMAALRGTSYGGASHFSFEPSRAVVLDYAERLDDAELRAAASNDLFWDRVVALEPAGEEEVFDLTVPGPSCWLADGIVSHNSGALEQDADLVVLIYRDDVYNKDPNNPDAGTAELILAKQRNGPTGVVKLAFLREQTRFANLAPGAGG
jgi:replicative DNA helicase